jgi:hypothetical protein
MTMRDSSELGSERPQIDLTGPQGNAFALMAHAEKWAKQLGMDPDPILEDMQSDDYDHLLEVLEEHFGDYVDFYR